MNFEYAHCKGTPLYEYFLQVLLKLIIFKHDFFFWRNKNEEEAKKFFISPFRHGSQNPIQQSFIKKFPLKFNYFN